MSDSGLGRESWDELWAKMIRERRDVVEARPPSPYLIAEAESLRPGVAADLGCGHGAEAMWLASRGWRVTAVDFSPGALEFARSLAAEAGPEVGGRIEWVEGDVASWAGERESFDLVTCLYVHIAGSVPEFVRRVAGFVAPGGSLLLVGHQDATRAVMPGQRQSSVADVIGALDLSSWEVVVAEERERPAGDGLDSVAHLRRSAGGPDRLGGP